ncbi:MAG: lipid-A-disaccharide synthase [Roseobacter sp.]|jgi:lipid-A-disaccharide synthase|nr:lipid-A-disaccharide synthase [Roseobacter sp.]
MRVFMIAGEPSGDKLGAALMAGLKALVPEVTFDGVGGAQMQAEGLQSRFPMQELSVMGIAEILPRYRALKRRIRQTADWVTEAPPDVMITIDSPDFCFRVARRVKAASSVRTVHYVAPTVWAWRPGRAARIAGFIDHLLTVLPFEPPYFTRHGMACDFVGHPVVAEPQPSQAEVGEFRATLGLGDAPVLLVLPGSREGEVRRLAPVFGDAIAPLIEVVPEMRVVVPAALPVAQHVAQAVQGWPVTPVILDPRGLSAEEAGRQKRAAFRAAGLALAASGTVSLELAAARTPMVIAYRMNWLSYQIIQRMALIDTVTLVNLVSDTRVVPEFLGPACRSEAIAAALRNTWNAPETQVGAMDLTMERLGQGQEAPGVRAARAVLSRMS